MTSPRRSFPRFRRLALVALAVAAAAPLAAAATVIATPDVADAFRPRSSSEEVAASAARALEILDEWRTDGDPGRYVEYLAARDLTAQQAAVELGVEAEELVLAWATTHPSKQIAVLGALTQLGVPYRSRMSQEGVGFDCSGLTTFAWARAGLEITRSSGDQVRAAAEVERDDAVAGDFVYYPGHVMMYLGVPNAVVHSPNSGNLVQITFVSDRRADTVVYADPLG